MAAHPAVTRTWATLRISGESLDPEAVTLSLEIRPSSSHRAGDRFGAHDAGIHRHGQWALTSEENVSSTDLEVHIEWILDQVEPVANQLRALMEQPGVEADLFCFWEAESVNAGFAFSPSVMGRAAALNLTVGVDIYFAF